MWAAFVSLCAVVAACGTADGVPVKSSTFSFRQCPVPDRCAVGTDESVTTATSGTATGHSAVQAVEALWPGNQWLGLLEALLTQRAWLSASRVVAWLSDASSTLDVAVCKPVYRALCSYLRELIAPVYHSVSPMVLLGIVNAAAPTVASPSSDLPVAESLVPVSDVASLVKTIRPVLHMLGPHLSNDITLFVRVCRVMVKAWKSTVAAPAPTAASAVVVSPTAGAEPY